MAARRDHKLGDTHHLNGQGQQQVTLAALCNCILLVIKLSAERKTFSFTPAL